MVSSLSLLLTALSAGSLFLAAFLLLTGLLTSNRLANRWLGAFFLLLSLLFVQLLLELVGKPDPVLIRLSEWPRWMIFPCVYFSVYAFVHPNQMPKYAFLHTLPALTFCLLSILNDMNLFVGNSMPASVQILVRYFFFVQGLSYTLLNLRTLISHKKHVRQLLADKGSDLNWLRNFVLAPFIMAIVWLVFSRWNVGEIVAQLIYLLLCLYFISAAFRQRAVYPVDIYTTQTIDKAQLAIADTHQRLTPEQIAILKDRVDLIMNRDRLYLDPTLNLKMMADKIGLNTHELSFVLNQGFEKNFYAYINELRAEEAIKLLQSGQYGHGNMTEVAIRSGFNSRTTFYSAIKKLKGISPANISNGGHQ